jgi:hypothetical protein
VGTTNARRQTQINNGEATNKKGLSSWDEAEGSVRSTMKHPFGFHLVLAQQVFFGLLSRSFETGALLRPCGIEAELMRFGCAY